MRNIFAVMICLLATGCSDYNFTVKTKKIEPGITVPEIEVDPVAHDFGALNAGYETQDITVTIENIGNGDLNLTDIYLQEGDENFSLTVIPSGLVEPSQSVELIVTYAPDTYEFGYDVIHILSNDEDEPEVMVYLDGTGDAPMIHITPMSYDFGSVFVGCDDALGILIENYGNANLEISDLEYFASLPVDFSIEDFESSEGPLPWTLTPTDYIHLRIEYTPLDILDDGAFLEITSNDPTSLVTVSTHEGIGEYESWIADSFTQDGDAEVDILFIVDNSGSMSSNQTNLKNNFEDFMAVFVSAGVDYHIAIITTDDATFVGDVITSTSYDPTTEFGNQVDLVGYSGSPNEKGLWYSYQSTSSGGDGAPGSSTGFFREASKLVLVYVSDEPDGSSSSSSMTPSDYSAHLLSLKSSAALVVAHAVAGDHPSGCTTNGGAQFGDGYYDVVADLGGTFMSICAADWSVTMDTLARESMAIVSFTLSADPIEDTIEVAVDGVLSADWIYDSSINSVVFTIVPSDGSAIDITYAILATCDTGT